MTGPTTSGTIQRRVVAAAATGLVVLAAGAAHHGGGTLAAAAVLGGLAGLALYHASFGFAGAWRRVLADGRSAGARAQLLLIGAGAVLSYPLLAAAETYGWSVSGFVNPIGLALVLGAFLFGIGMQIGGGCGSGTLFTAGGGDPRMVVTLAAFVAGSLAAVLHAPVWQSWPAVPGISVIAVAGWAPALAGLVAILSLATTWLMRHERRRHGAVASLGGNGERSWLHGPWPLLRGALALAVVAVAILAATGAPWGITSAFALWGSKLAGLAGAEPATWPYWAGDPSIRTSILADRTSVLDIGLMLGALGAAGLAGRFRPWTRPAPGALAAAVLGGLMMGYGARLATGCNIGAFVSGTMSGSLHGPLWLVFALPGTWIGAKLRPFFGLGH
ncbi:MAG: YeeE/YedE family protein [Phreatobacter sp.]|uniref:YeeE/YedE family protein n=1 Tax=Phreatobacter sp. TaxID=1966341 RepID=UPI004035DFE6